MFSDLRIMARFVCMVALAMGAAGALGQASTAPGPSATNTAAVSQPPSFEVATIKPAPGGIAGFVTSPGGRMKCGFCNLDMLLNFAFDVQPYQIVGEPDWGHHQGYSIDALPPDSSESRNLKLTSPTHALTTEQREMLQSLLMERFQLKFHRESKIGSVYILTKGRGDLKLHDPKDKGSSPGVWMASDGLVGQNASMPLLAMRLSSILQRPVLDETGLSGSFDFKSALLDNDPKEEYQEIVASILTSVEGIGLKLNSAKGPVETIVIDHIEQPSPN
ncbi:MAG: TIGR03435 family protein [Terracidiphilus sp.]